MADESEVLLQYFKVRRVLNMVSGICFLVYILVFPALYFTLSNSNNGDYSYLLYAPLSVCLVIQIVCASLILHYRRKALHQIATSAVNYTHQVAHAPPPGMATVAYQNPQTGQQQLYMVHQSALPQFYDNANVASFPSATSLNQQHQGVMAPPPYSSTDPGAPPGAGWAIPQPSSAAGSTEQIDHSSQKPT